MYKHQVQYHHLNTPKDVFGRKMISLWGATIIPLVFPIEVNHNSVGPPIEVSRIFTGRDHSLVGLPVEVNRSVIGPPIKVNHISLDC